MNSTAMAADIAETGTRIPAAIRAQTGMLPVTAATTIMTASNTHKQKPKITPNASPRARPAASLEPRSAMLPIVAA